MQYANVTLKNEFDGGQKTGRIIVEVSPKRFADRPAQTRVFTSADEAREFAASTVPAKGDWHVEDYLTPRQMNIHCYRDGVNGYYAAEGCDADGVGHNFSWEPK